MILDSTHRLSIVVLMILCVSEEIKRHIDDIINTSYTNKCVTLGFMYSVYGKYHTFIVYRKDRHVDHLQNQMELNNHFHHKQCKTSGKET